MRLVRLTREDNVEIYVAPQFVTVVHQIPDSLVSSNNVVISFTNSVTLFVKGPVEEVLEKLQKQE
jgi:uncharacterized protein YlzI (FlbEa/FlbD family)